MNRHVFDSFTGILEDFFSENREEVDKLRHEVKEFIFSPLKPFYETSLSQKKASEILQQCFKLTEAKFSEVAGHSSIDRWLFILRRFPPKYQESNWETYLSLSLLRYSNWNIDSTLGKISSNNQFGIIQNITENELFDSFRLDALATYMAFIAITQRYVGKGAKLKPTSEEPLNRIVPKEIQTAIDLYESRRPKEFLFSEQGFLVELALERIYHPLLILLESPTELRFWEPRQNIGLLAHYLPFVVDAKPILKVLTVYEDPIKDIFGVSCRAIIHFLCAVSTLILHSFPKFTNSSLEKGILLEPDDESYEYQHKLEFMFGIIQKGYLRFEYNHWLNRLSEVTSIWAPNKSDSNFLIKEFLNGFIVKSNDAEQREKINLSTLTPIPLLFESPNKEIYFDFTLIMDFLGGILEGAKDWYSSHHGDMFTLSLKKYIESQTSAQVIGWKRIFKAGNKKAEVDLLVHSKSSLYSIECKAFGKSREYFRGDSQAINQRRNRIKKAVKQAKEATSIVKTILNNPLEQLPSVRRIKTVVCTPTQEYLKPLQEHGMLSDDIPLVCTPEEFIHFLNQNPD